jgi:hypothetical protein
MVWVIAFSSPDSYSISSKNLCEKLHHNLLILYTVTNPAAETKSIGLLADASAGWRIMVFATPS